MADKHPTARRPTQIVAAAEARAYLKSVTRLSIGLAANIPASDGWGLQLGGSYSQKGGRFEISEQGVSGESRVETDYLEFTVLGRARFPVSGDRVSAHLLAGPALALESSCGFTAKATGPDGGTFEFAEDCDQPRHVKSQRQKWQKENGRNGLAMTADTADIQRQIRTPLRGDNDVAPRQSCRISICDIP